MRYGFRMFLAAVLLHAVYVSASEPADARLQEPLGGTLILHGGGAVSGDVRDAFSTAVGGRKARIAQLSEGTPGTIFGKDDYAELRVLQAESRAASEAPAFLESLRSANGVWIAGSRAKLEALYAHPAIGSALRAVLERGGVVAGSGGGAELLARGGPLTNFQIVSHYNEGAPLTMRPGFVALGLAEETALIVRQRWMGVMGRGKVRVQYAKSSRRPELGFDWTPASRGDLISLSRAALARAEEPPFPPSEAPVPEVPEKGLLVIGGSGVPRAGVERFVKHCGGSAAKIVIVTSALEERPSAEPYEVNLLRRYGVTEIAVVHAAIRAEAESPAVLDPIRNATGLWFCGGRQWRLVDKYLGTAAEKEMHALLARGGAIAGGSAGATIQGDYLVRGNPLGNVQMMVEGYERGLGFLKGVAIDQHFSQRDRFKDMTLFKSAVPHYLGIGIDEDTALLVSGHVAEIVGNHAVAFYDRGQPLPPGAKDYTSLRAGEFYDLKERKRK